MTTAKRKPRPLRMVVTVPRLEGQTPAQQRAEVRYAIQHSGDYYGRRVGVKAAGAKA